MASVSLLIDLGVSMSRMPLYFFAFDTRLFHISCSILVYVLAWKGIHLVRLKDSFEEINESILSIELLKLVVGV